MNGMPRCVTTKEHDEHHETLRVLLPLLREYVEERKQSQERWEKIRASALGTAVTFIVGGFFGLLAWIGKVAIAAIEHGDKV